MKISLFVAIFTASLACGCTATKVDKIETTIDPSYAGDMKKLSFIQGKGVDFTDKMMTNIVNDLRSCGIESKFYLSNNFMNSDFFRDSDSAMRIEILNHDETTIRTVAYTGTYVSRITYEFFVRDARSNKDVWQAHMDFHQDWPGANGNLQYADPDIQWSKALLNRMIQDGLLKSCGSRQF